MIRFKANGKAHELPDSICVYSFIEGIKLNPGSVIVEYNKEFLPGSEFETTFIKHGDTMEIIRAFAGG